MFILSTTTLKNILENYVFVLACVDAYLNSTLREYISSFKSGFKNLPVSISRHDVYYLLFDNI